MNSENMDNHLHIAREAAVAAGRYLSGCSKGEIRIDSSRGKDIKISADRESEEIIINLLREKSNISILSEENGFKEASNGDSDLSWVVDPLDGSINFLRDIPVCCVSVALYQKDKPVLGAIYDFNREELFTGIAGTGAWLNDKPIEVSEIDAVSEAVLYTGFPANTDYSPAALGNYITRIRSFKKLRWIGSAALSLAYVAAGRGDAYLEKGIMLWDVGAGLAIVSGAGGKYFISEGDKYNTYNVYAANNSLPNILG